MTGLEIGTGQVRRENSGESFQASELFKCSYYAVTVLQLSNPSWYVAIGLPIIPQALPTFQLAGQPTWEFSWLSVMIATGQTNKIQFVKFLRLDKKPPILMREACHFFTNSLEDLGGSQKPFLFAAKMSHWKLSTTMVRGHCYQRSLKFPHNPCTTALLPALASWLNKSS